MKLVFSLLENICPLIEDNIPVWYTPFLSCDTFTPEKEEIGKI
jgi:hypothetical protein